MIDTNKETLLTIQQAAKSLPNRKGGRGLNFSTVWRWVLNGCRGHKLETVLVGGTRFTSHEAIERFQAAINGTSVPSVTPADRQASIDRARRVCERAGI